MLAALSLLVVPISAAFALSLHGDAAEARRRLLRGESVEGVVVGLYASPRTLSSDSQQHFATFEYVVDGTRRSAAISVDHRDLGELPVGAVRRLRVARGEPPQAAFEGENPAVQARGTVVALAIVSLLSLILFLHGTALLLPLLILSRRGRLLRGELLSAEKTGRDEAAKDFSLRYRFTTPEAKVVEGRSRVRIPRGMERPRAGAAIWVAYVSDRLHRPL